MTRQTFIQTKFKILVGQLIVIVKVKKDLIIDFIASFENIIAAFGYGVNIVLILEFQECSLGCILTTGIGLAKLTNRRELTPFF